MFRHKEFAIDQGAGSISNQGGKNTDLTVVCLAQAPIPLPSDASRHLAFLRKGRFVEHQGSPITEMLIGILD